MKKTSDPGDELSDGEHYRLLKTVFFAALGISSLILNLGMTACLREQLTT